jgi:hypothetical protein
VTYAAQNPGSAALEQEIRADQELIAKGQATSVRQNAGLTTIAGRSGIWNATSDGCNPICAEIEADMEDFRYSRALRG